MDAYTYLTRGRRPMARVGAINNPYGGFGNFNPMNPPFGMTPWFPGGGFPGGPGTVNPGGPGPLVPYPNGGVPVPPQMCAPYGPGCSPCLPPPEVQALAYAMQQAQCYSEGVNSQRAYRAVVAANQPQIALPINTLRQSPNTQVLPGETRTLTVTSKSPLCITQMRVARGESAENFLIDRLDVDRINYMSGGQGASADDFSSDANMPPMEMPYLYPGVPLELVITNKDDAPHHFFAKFFGIPGPLPQPCV